MLAASAAGSPLLRSLPLLPLQLPSACAHGQQRLKLVGRPSLLQRCPQLRPRTALCSPRAADRMCSRCGRVAAAATSTAERTVQTSEAGWRGSEHALQAFSDSCDAQWSQAETATSAADIWRQQQQQQQHGSGPWPSAGPSANEAPQARAGDSSTADATVVDSTSTTVASSSTSSLGSGSSDDCGSSNVGGATGTDTCATDAEIEQFHALHQGSKHKGSTNEAWVQLPGLPECERIRREKISSKAKGRAPWNKGYGEVRLRYCIMCRPP